MNPSLRARLLLVISCTVIVAFSVTQYGQYVMIRQQLYSEFDQTIGSQVRGLAVMIKQEPDSVVVEFHARPMQEFARIFRPEYYEVWHEDGTVLARSRRLQDNDLALLKGDMVVPMIRDVILPDGRRGRAAGLRFRLQSSQPPVATEAVAKTLGGVDKVDEVDEGSHVIEDTSGRAWVTLVVAKDTNDLEASLSRTIWLFVGSGGLSCILILAVLAWLVTRNLRPLDSLALQISDINVSGLNQRFDLPDAPAELQPVVMRLNTLMSHLESAFQREKHFTADVAHELRTPLAGIRSTLEVELSRHRDANSYRECMKRCLRISKETEKIIATLLSLSRVEDGQATREYELIDVGRLLRHTWEMFTGRAVERGLQIEWLSDQPVVLDSDPDKLHVVMSNLFDNATSYVNSGGLIQIETRLNDCQLVIRVTNTGCLLTSNEILNVFDRFWRSDLSRSETGTHSGLGLALTRQIVQFLGGTIDARVFDGIFIATVTFPMSQVSIPAASDDDFEMPMPERILCEFEAFAMPQIADAGKV